MKDITKTVSTQNKIILGMGVSKLLLAILYVFWYLPSNQ